MSGRFKGMSFGVNVGSVLVLSSLLFSPQFFSYAFTSFHDMPPLYRQSTISPSWIFCQVDGTIDSAFREDTLSFFSIATLDHPLEP